jgi:DNA-binding XRE family transcriptional regulator
MSAHMKTHHTKANNPIFCISEQGQVYKLPQSVLRKYIVNDNVSIKKAKNHLRSSLSITPEDAFADINAKYTKAGALLKAVRIREGLNQKAFAKLIEVTQGDLSKMENGKRPIGKNLVNRIAKKFKSRIA